VRAPHVRRARAFPEFLTKGVPPSTPSSKAIRATVTKRTRRTTSLDTEMYIWNPIKRRIVA
jgi:hypothetical protein